MLCGYYASDGCAVACCFTQELPQMRLEIAITGELKIFNIF